ncbi:MAG TPA: SH3 domain-containing protein, partial [Chitinophagales bacterium]|nr:SH3 domain-containing protein [Chitinophagales bacterium]
MKYGIASLSIIPLRKEPAHRSEMVSQLLFGETYEVIQEQNNWMLVKCSYDGYEGWIDQSQFAELPEKEAGQIESSSGLALELISSATSGYHA